MKKLNNKKIWKIITMIKKIKKKLKKDRIK